MGNVEYVAQQEALRLKEQRDVRSNGMYGFAKTEQTDHGLIGAVALRNPINYFCSSKSEIRVPLRPESVHPVAPIPI